MVLSEWFVGRWLYACELVIRRWLLYVTSRRCSAADFVRCGDRLHADSFTDSPLLRRGRHRHDTVGVWLLQLNTTLPVVFFSVVGQSEITRVCNAEETEIKYYLRHLNLDYAVFRKLQPTYKKSPLFLIDPFADFFLFQCSDRRLVRWNLSTQQTHVHTVVDILIDRCWLWS